MATDMKMAVVLSLRNELTTGLRTANTEIRGFRKEVKTAQADFAAKWGEIAQVSKTAGLAIAGAGLAIVGSLGAAAKSAADFGSELWDMHTRTGASVESLSAMKYAAEQTGTSLQGVQNGLKFVAKNAYDATRGLKEQEDAFAALGVEVTDESGKLKSSEALFMEVGNALRGMTNDAERSALAMRVFGRSGQMLLPMFLDTKGSVTDLMAEAKKLGLVMSTEAAQAADDFGDELDKLKSQSKMLWVQMGSNAIPTLQVLSGWLSAGTGMLQAFSKEHPALAGAATVAAGALGLLMIPLGAALWIIPQAAAAWNVLRVILNAEALASARAQVATLGAAVAARSSGVAAYWSAGGWTAFGNSMIVAGTRFGILAGIVASVVGWLRSLKNIMDDIAQSRWAEVAFKVIRWTMFPANIAGEGAAEIIGEKTGLIPKKATAQGRKGTSSGGTGTAADEAEYIRKRIRETKAQEAAGGGTRAVKREAAAETVAAPDLEGVPADYAAEAKAIYAQAAAETEKAMKDAGLDVVSASTDYAGAVGGGGKQVATALRGTTDDQLAAMQYAQQNMSDAQMEMWDKEMARRGWQAQAAPESPRRFVKITGADDVARYYAVEARTVASAANQYAQAVRESGTSVAAAMTVAGADVKAAKKQAGQEAAGTAAAVTSAEKPAAGKASPWVDAVRGYTSDVMASLKDRLAGRDVPYRAFGRQQAITIAEGFSGGPLTAAATNSGPESPEDALYRAYNRYNFGGGAPPVTPTSRPGTYMVERSPYGQRHEMQLTPEQALQRMQRLQEERDQAHITINVNGAQDPRATANEVRRKLEERDRQWRHAPAR
jgi:TP901 family phage tail tape measure protein